MQYKNTSTKSGKNGNKVIVNNYYRTNTKGDYLDSSSSGNSILIVILLALFFVNLSYFFFNPGNSMFFSSFLNSLGNDNIVVDVSVVQNFSQSRITKDWTLWLSKELEIGITFNWLRDFLNNFVMPILSMVAFFLAGVTQLIVFIAWGLGFIFGR